VIKNAIFSPCRRYRYALWRTWDQNKPSVLFIGLNPSTADETNDDPTLTRCINYAKYWGYGSVCIANIFAYRATKPKELFARKRIIGKENNHWLFKLANDADLVIAAWGNHGQYKNRSSHVKLMFKQLHCLKLTKKGEPAHPLYLRADLTPTLFAPKIKAVD
jgi:hypothetical protein|tara:strand:+ start:411 stop:896 length:486 start_codon:yes stop_codon:yes gene_type:complete